MDERLGAAVRQHVGEARRLLPGADRHRNRAKLQRREQDGGKRHVVAEQQRHPVAALYSTFSESGRAPRHEVGEAHIGQPGIAADEGLALGVAGNRPLEHGVGIPRPLGKAANDAAIEMRLETRRRHGAEPGRW